MLAYCAGKLFKAPPVAASKCRSIGVGHVQEAQEAHVEPADNLLPARSRKTTRTARSSHVSTRIFALSASPFSVCRWAVRLYMRMAR